MTITINEWSIFILILILIIYFNFISSKYNKYDYNEDMDQIAISILSTKVLEFIHRENHFEDIFVFTFQNARIWITHFKAISFEQAESWSISGRDIDCLYLDFNYIQESTKQQFIDLIEIHKNEKNQFFKSSRNTN